MEKEREISMEEEAAGRMLDAFMSAQPRPRFQPRIAEVCLCQRCAMQSRQRLIKPGVRETFAAN